MIADKNIKEQEIKNENLHTMNNIISHLSNN
jgi:hypothetical protein